jgi:DNA-binding response OmpR family regulator
MKVAAARTPSLVATPNGVRRRTHELCEPVRAILVVEDDYDLRNVVVETLWAEGYAAVGVSTLGEARAELEESSPLLLIVDRRLPDGDGLAVVRELRWRRATATVPVIALTAASTRRDVDDAFVAGCEAFLAKPCASAALLATVRRFLRS